MVLVLVTTHACGVRSYVSDHYFVGLEFDLGFFLSLALLALCSGDIYI